MNPIKLLRTSLLTLGLLGILHSNIQAGEIEQRAFIERFYQNILNRTADDTGMNTWLNTIQNQSATQVAIGFLNSPEFVNKNLSNEEFLDIMYQTMFNRDADNSGKQTWLNLLSSGTLRQEVMYGFFNSQEFKNLTDNFGVVQIRPEDQLNDYGTIGVNGYVNRFYKLVLGRFPDDGGFSDWVNQLNAGTKAGGDIAKGFFFSPEYQNRDLDNLEFLDIAYRAFFDREADNNGKANWLVLLNQGYTKNEIINGFIGSQEFINLANNFDINVGEGSADEFDISGGEFIIKGFAQKGPYQAGTGITIQPLNESLNQTGQSYTTNTINEKGEYKLNATVNNSLVEIFADGYYYDEISNTISSSPLQLSTIVNLKETENANINLLTSLIKPRILTLISSGETFVHAKNRAEMEVLAAFGITNISIDFENLELLTNNRNTKILLAVTSILLQASHTDNPNSITGALSSLHTLIKTDIGDNGVLDDPILKEKIKNASMNVDIELIKTNLTSKYGYLIPNFEEYIDSDGDGIISKDDTTLAKIRNLNFQYDFRNLKYITSKNNDKLFLLAGDTLKILDISTNITRQIGEYKLSESIYDINSILKLSSDEKLLFIGKKGDKKLYIFDMTNLNEIVQKSILEFSGFTSSTTENNTTIYNTEVIEDMCLDSENDIINVILRRGISTESSMFQSNTNLDLYLYKYNISNPLNIIEVLNKKIHSTSTMGGRTPETLHSFLNLSTDKKVLSLSTNHSQYYTNNSVNLLINLNDASIINEYNFSSGNKISATHFIKNNTSLFIEFDMQYNYDKKNMKIINFSNINEINVRDISFTIPWRSNSFIFDSSLYIVTPEQNASIYKLTTYDISDTDNIVNIDNISLSGMIPSDLVFSNRFYLSSNGKLYSLLGTNTENVNSFVEFSW